MKTKAFAPFKGTVIVGIALAAVSCASAANNGTPSPNPIPTVSDGAAGPSSPSSIATNSRDVAAMSVIADGGNPPASATDGRIVSTASADTGPRPLPLASDGAVSPPIDTPAGPLPPPLMSAYSWTYRATVDVPSASAIEFLLWVPPTATHVRGIILCSEARLGQLGGDPTIRAVVAQQQLAILGFRNAPFSARFDTAKNDHVYLQQGLTKLAQTSGFPEIEHAPLLSYGHSVGAIFAYQAPFWNPKRFFGAILENGFTTQRPPGITTEASDVPMVSSRGEREVEQTGSQWAMGRDEWLTLRTRGNLVNMLVQPGAGHFSWTPFEVHYLSRFIAKAATRRIPAGVYATSGPIELTPIKESDGWLSDSAPDAPQIQTAAFAAYTGDRAKAFWHFDREMAELWRDSHQREFAKKPQTITMSKYPACAAAFNPPCANHVLGTNGDLIDLGASASSGLPVRLSSYNGPFAIEAGKARVDACQFEISPKGWVVAMQDGNDTYRAAEKVLLVQVTKGGAGAVQTITFDPISDKTVGDPSFAFTATSSSGLAVGSYVVSGAVSKTGTMLHLEPFPRGTSEVLIRHCQSGGPAIQTAPNVTDSFILKSGK